MSIHLLNPYIKHLNNIINYVQVDILPHLKQCVLYQPLIKSRKYETSMTCENLHYQPLYIVSDLLSHHFPPLQVNCTYFPAHAMRFLNTQSFPLPRRFPYQGIGYFRLNCVHSPRRSSEARPLILLEIFKPN